MTVGNSSSFLSAGMLMSLCPRFLPDCFPATLPYDISTSALWLQTMGALHVIAGGLGMWSALRAALRQRKAGPHSAFATKISLGELRPASSDQEANRLGPDCPAIAPDEFAPFASFGPPPHPAPAWQLQ